MDEKGPNTEPVIVDDGTLPSEIRFIYTKARHHRTLHADGAWAAITPQLEVQFAFFNDIKPMPEEVLHSVTADGTLGGEVARKHNRMDIVREADVTVVMSAPVLKSTIALLSRMVEQIESQVSKAQAVEGVRPDATDEVQKDS
jgi:hypothetical protein